ncbi:MAG: transporter [Vicinamibacterales bacterium]
MSTRRTAPSLVALLLLVSSTAHAQSDQSTPEFVTDRPGYTETTSIVGRGFVQFEMGTTFEANRVLDAEDRTLSTPLALVRLGLSRRVELRASTDGYILDWLRGGTVSSTTTGEADFEIGTKVMLTNGSWNGVRMALLPMVSLPTGSKDMSSGTFDPTIKFCWETDLPRRFSLSGNVNVMRLDDDRGRLTEQVVTLSLGRDLLRGWSGYWEVFGFIPRNRPGTAAWTLDTGVTHPIGGNAQLDVEVGHGTTTAATDWSIGVGVGLRTSFRRGR